MTDSFASYAAFYLPSLSLFLFENASTSILGGAPEGLVSLFAALFFLRRKMDKKKEDVAEHVKIIRSKS